MLFRWPDSESIVITCLIPKVSEPGALRPIGLFRALHRVFSRVMVWPIKLWFKGNGPRRNRQLCRPLTRRCCLAGSSEC